MSYLKNHKIAKKSVFKSIFKKKIKRKLKENFIYINNSLTLI